MGLCSRLCGAVFGLKVLRFSRAQRFLTDYRLAPSDRFLRRLDKKRGSSYWEAYLLPLFWFAYSSTRDQHNKRGGEKNNKTQMSWNWHGELIFMYIFKGLAIKNTWRRKTETNFEITSDFVMQWISFRRNTHCFVWKLSEGVYKGVKLLPQLNNTSHKANLVEQKQSISDLKSWQITTCDAKADWHFRWWEGGNLYFKAIQHETSCTK